MGKLQTTFLDDLDGRTGVTQALRARFEALTADLGGAERLSYSQRSLVERAIMLEYWLAQQERLLAAGEPFPISTWIQASYALAGLLDRFDHLRQDPDLPSIGDYFETLRERDTTGDTDDE